MLLWLLLLVILSFEEVKEEVIEIQQAGRPVVGTIRGRITNLGEKVQVKSHPLHRHLNFLHTGELGCIDSLWREQFK